MSLQRIILTVPFMRHYAGSVFELYDNPTPEGWDEDERLREKISFLNKRSFLLPDSGKGAPVSLSKSDTIPCPARLFDGVNLNTGPCRITGVQLSNLKQAIWKEADASLYEIDGQTAQGIRIQMESYADAPFHMECRDVRENQAIQTFETQQTTISLDFSGLAPGFYQLQVTNPDGMGACLHFIKSFPLVVVFKAGTNQINGTMKTVY